MAPCLPERQFHAVFFIHYSFIDFQILLPRLRECVPGATYLFPTSFVRLQRRLYCLRGKEDLGPAAVQEGNTNLNSSVSICSQSPPVRVSHCY